MFPLDNVYRGQYGTPMLPTTTQPDPLSPSGFDMTRLWRPTRIGWLEQHFAMLEELQLQVEKEAERQRALGGVR